MSTLNLPLVADDRLIFDAIGEPIADVEERTVNGAPADEGEDAEAAELARQRAAEIVICCNAFPALVALLKEAGEALNGIPNRTINGDRKRTTYGLAYRIEAALKGMEGC